MGIQECDPGFPRPEAATTALQNNYKCLAAPGGYPRAAFLIKNHLVPHITDTIYSRNGLAAALRIHLPNDKRRTIVNIYPKFNKPDKKEIDDFIRSMSPYDLLMGDFNDALWNDQPNRPWQEGLQTADLIDPLLASSHQPEATQYYTRIPKRGNPRRLDAILIRQQTPNIGCSGYEVVHMPISDHAMVLLRIAWGKPTQLGLKRPPPTVARWFTPQFKRYANMIASLPHKPHDTSLNKTRRILAATARAARPHTRKQTEAVRHTQADNLEKRGEEQELHLRKRIAAMRRQAVRRSGCFFNLVKRWCRGLITSDSPQPPIGGTAHIPFRRRPNMRHNTVPGTHTPTHHETKLE